MYDYYIRRYRNRGDETAGRPAVAEEVVDLGGIIFGFYCRTRETHTAAAGRVSDSGAWTGRQRCNGFFTPRIKKIRGGRQARTVMRDLHTNRKTVVAGYFWFLGVILILSCFVVHYTVVW